MKIQKNRRLFHCCLLVALIVSMLTLPVHAEEASSAGNIAGVVSGIWANASGQVKSICNSVVFPAFSVACAIGFVISVILSVVHYRKNHTVEVGWPIALLIGLLVSLTASTWVWALAGI